MDILKEGRKYKLGCVLATQDLNFDQNLARTMLNVGNIVSFRLGNKEAQAVARELNMTPNDIQFLEKHHVAFMTHKETGIGKAPRPPFVKKMEPKRPEPKSETEEWFILESYHQQSL